AKLSPCGGAPGLSFARPPLNPSPHSRAGSRRGVAGRIPKRSQCPRGGPMKLGLDTLRRLLGYGGVVALAVTGASTLVLAVALFLKVKEPRPVVLVPGLDRPRAVLPGRVPDTLARDFAIALALALAHHSPATVGGGVKFLKGRLGPPT